MSSQEPMLRTLFQALGREKVSYCVIHSADDLPANVGSDLDLAVAGQDVASFEAILCGAARACGWTVIQRLWYDVPLCMYYVLRGPEGQWLAVDALMDDTGISRYGYTSGELIAGRIPVDGIFYRAAPAVELCYKLVKRSRKRELRDEDPELLERLWKDSDRDAAIRGLRRAFGSVESSRLIAALDDDPTVLQDSRVLRRMSRANLWRCRYSRPVRVALRAWWQLLRVMDRFLRPTGLRIVIPVGMGEASTKALSRKAPGVGAAFRRVIVDDRPSLFRTFIALASATLLVSRRDLLDGVRVFESPLPWTASSGARVQAQEEAAEPGADRLIHEVLEVLMRRVAQRVNG